MDQKLHLTQPLRGAKDLAMCGRRFPGRLPPIKIVLTNRIFEVVESDSLFSNPSGECIRGNLD